MREPDGRTEVVITIFKEEDVSQVAMERGGCNNLFASSLKCMNEYEYVIKEIEQILFEDGKEVVGIKQFQIEDNQQQVKGGEVHYCEPIWEDIIKTDGVEDRLTDSVMNSTENSNQHSHVLTKEKEKTMQQTELLSKENKAQQPCVFNSNNLFLNAFLVADSKGDLAQMNNQMEVKEENYMEEINPWNKEVNFLEKMLNNHDSIMKEGKDDREAASKPKDEASKEKMAVSQAGVSIGVNITSKEKEDVKSTTKVEVMYTMAASKASVEDNNDNLEHKERERSKEQNMDQPKDMLDIEFEEIRQMMMQQFKWRKM